MSVADGTPPAHDSVGAAGVEQQVDADRGQHAAESRPHRKDRLANVGERSHRHLVLDLETHQKEEHRHEDVVDDVGKRHLGVGRAPTDRHLGVPELREGAVTRRVRHNECDDRAQQHDGRCLGGGMRQLDDLVVAALMTLGFLDENAGFPGMVLRHGAPRLLSLRILYQRTRHFSMTDFQRLRREQAKPPAKEAHGEARSSARRAHAGPASPPTHGKGRPPAPPPTRGKMHSPAPPPTHGTARYPTQRKKSSRFRQYRTDVRCTQREDRLKVALFRLFSQHIRQIRGITTLSISLSA